jgi:hypothetical protein
MKSLLLAATSLTMASAAYDALSPPRCSCWEIADIEFCRALLPRSPAPTAPPSLKLPRQVPADFTTTLANGAVLDVDGSSTTTVQAGASMTFQMDPTAKANAGTFNPDQLFTSVSASLEAACPTPTAGQTITGCNSVEPVSSVIYVAYNAEEPKGDGLLEIDVPIVSYYDANVRTALITAIAQAVRNSANQASNQYRQMYGGRGLYPGTTDHYFNMRNVGSHMLAEYTDQEASTGGIVKLQNMEIEMAFAAFDGGEFACSDVALGADMASLLSVIPGLEWLAVLGPAFSIACDAIDHAGGS